MRKRPNLWKQGGVVISVGAPHAKEVFLVGTFNGWNTKSHPMKRLLGGDWTITIEHLTSGHYEYKFMIDGEWCCEPGCDTAYDGCPACVPNAFGTMNRVLEVAEHQGPKGPISSAKPECAE